MFNTPPVSQDKKPSRADLLMEEIRTYCQTHQVDAELLLIIGKALSMIDELQSKVNAGKDAMGELLTGLLTGMRRPRTPDFGPRYPPTFGKDADDL